MHDLEEKVKEDLIKKEEETVTAVGDSMTSQSNDMMASFLARASEQKKQEQTPVTAENVVQAIVEV